MVGYSDTTNRSRASVRVVFAPPGFVANELLDMLGCIGGIDTSSEVAISNFKFQGSDCSRACQGCESRACGLYTIVSSYLTIGVGQKLLLVEVHLPLDFMLSVVARSRRNGRVRAVGTSDRRSCLARTLGKVCGMEAWQ
jgi:hypothetical protein